LREVARKKQAEYEKQETISEEIKRRKVIPFKKGTG